MGLKKGIKKAPLEGLKKEMVPTERK